MFRQKVTLKRDIVAAGVINDVIIETVMTVVADMTIDVKAADDMVAAEDTTEMKD